MNAIIYSKNRPMQLDLLLRSIDQFANAAVLPAVICAATGQNYLDGYERLRQDCDAIWLWQKYLKDDTLKAFDDDPLTMFLVDDAVFYRPMPELPDLQLGEAYATRLGRNCTHCYAGNHPQTEGTFDFAYSYSLDGHVYRTEEIKALIERVNFTTPTELEVALNEHGPRLNLLYAEHSCLVGIPHNVVQRQCPNRNAGGSAEELNQMFLDGLRIDLDAMDFSDVCGCHQEIPYVFKRAE